MAEKEDNQPQTEYYEEPSLLDLEDVAGGFAASACSTGGGANCPRDRCSTGGAAGVEEMM